MAFGHKQKHVKLKVDFSKSRRAAAAGAAAGADGIVECGEAKQQQVHGFISWWPPCQFITQLMVTLMTATNDTNRPVLIPTHPVNHPAKEL